MLRRFEKRILIDVPDELSRMEMFKYHFAKNGFKFQTNELKQLAQMTKNYSGSEIKLVCKEAMMSVVREYLQDGNLNTKEFKKENIRSLILKDVVNAVGKIKSCVSTEMLERYHKWNEKFGCT